MIITAGNNGLDLMKGKCCIIQLDPNQLHKNEKHTHEMYPHLNSVKSMKSCSCINKMLVK